MYDQLSLAFDKTRLFQLVILIHRPPSVVNRWVSNQKCFFFTKPLGSRGAWLCSLSPVGYLQLYRWWVCYVVIHPYNPSTRFTIKYLILCCILINMHFFVCLHKNDSWVKLFDMLVTSLWQLFFVMGLILLRLRCHNKPRLRFSTERRNSHVLFFMNKNNTIYALYMFFFWELRYL